MDVLITGATGYIGGAVAEAMDRAGHAVHGLAHGEAMAEGIERRGWRAVAGDLRDADGLRGVAGSFDAVVHVANTGGADAGAVDTAATRAVLAALRGTRKAFVYTSGAWVLGAGATHEGSPRRPVPLIEWRGALEEEVLATAPGVRAVIVRPGVAYGRGGGIPGMLARGELPVVGDGHQRWPLVHVEDLADLYVRALTAPAGAVLHGVATSATMRELALLGAASHGRLDPPAELSLAAARERLGEFADALALDQRVSSRVTRELTGWRPTADSLGVSPAPATELRRRAAGL
jgi:nucleoside-diphosphate-sugar epimerase